MSMSNCDTTTPLNYYTIADEREQNYKEDQEEWHTLSGDCNDCQRKFQNLKTIYITSKTHNSTKTLWNDYYRLPQHRSSYLQPIWSLTCPYMIQESNRGLRDAIPTVLGELTSQEEP